MDVESLKLFVKVADILNISAAGRALGLAPAMASSRIAKLESYIGADLFHRSTRHVRLSAEGEFFLPFATKMLAEHDAAMEAIRAESHPSISSKMVSISRCEAPRFKTQGFVQESSLRIEGSYVHPPIISHELPEDLRQHQIIGFKDRKPRLMTHAVSGATAVFPPQYCQARLVCDDGTSMRIATIEGVGVSMNALWSVAADLKQGRLVQVLPDYEVDQDTDIWLVYPKANALSPKVRAFIDFLVEKIGAPPVWERD
jgi:DNA-binding transcriptional LysR family regulator